MTVIETLLDLSVLEVWFVKYLSRWIRELNVVGRQWDKLPSSALGNNKLELFHICSAIVSDKILKFCKACERIVKHIKSFRNRKFK